MDAGRPLTTHTRRLADRSLSTEKETNATLWEKKYNQQTSEPAVKEFKSVEEAKAAQQKFFQENQQIVTTSKKLQFVTEMDDKKHALDEHGYQQYLQDTLFRIVSQPEIELQQLRLVVNRIDPAFPYPNDRKRPIEMVANKGNWAGVLVFAEFATNAADNGHYGAALTYAVAAGKLDVVKKLRAKNAKVDVTVEHFLPLDYAAYANNIEMIKFLLSEGASPDACPVDSQQSVREGMQNAAQSAKRDEILQLFDIYPAECVTNYTHLAKEYEQADQVELVEKNYQKILAIQPNHQYAHQGLITLYEKQKKFPLAVLHYELLIQYLLESEEGRPSNAENCIYLAKLCCQLANILCGESIQATFTPMQLIDIALSFCDGYSDQPSAKEVILAAHTSAGWIMYEESQWAEALQWFVTAIHQMQPEKPSPDLLFACAECAQKIGRLDIASQYFLELIEAKKQQETQNKVSRVTSDNVSEKRFMAMLDHIYIKPAQKLLNQGDLLGALTILDQIVEEYPKHDDIREIFFRVAQEIRFIIQDLTAITGKGFIDFLACNPLFPHITESSSFKLFLHKLNGCLQPVADYPIFMQKSYSNIFSSLQNILKQMPNAEEMLGFFQQMSFLVRHGATVNYLLADQQIGEDKAHTQMNNQQKIASHYGLPHLCMRIIRAALIELPATLQKDSELNAASLQLKKMADQFLMVSPNQELYLHHFVRAAQELRTRLFEQKNIAAIRALSDESRDQMGNLLYWINCLRENPFFASARIRWPATDKEQSARASQSRNVLHPCTPPSKGPPPLVRMPAKEMMLKK